MKKGYVFGLTVAVLAIALCAVPASATLLLHETFDQADATGLSTQVDVAAAGTWFGTTFDDAPSSCTVESDGSLSYTGIEGSAGRLLATNDGGGGATIVFYPTPVTGEGNSVYVSFLFKPLTSGNTYIMYNATAEDATNATYPSWPVDASAPVNSQLGRFDYRADNAPNGTLTARWRAGGTRVVGPALTIGQTYFIVMKSTMVPGVDNDTIEFFVDPVADGTEPATPTVAAIGNVQNTPPAPDDVSPTSGFLGFAFRTTGSSSGTWEFDELRAGTTWADVTSSLAPAGDGDGDGDGGSGEVGTPEAGMPVTGALGLGLVAAACALGGSMFLRKK